MLLKKELEDKQIRVIELGFILVSCLFPLLMDLPYRVNIFLSWEGAYRMYLGQVPFKDFGMPLGYGYFIIPFLFFKIFGPFLFSLVIAQVFINIVTLLCFSNLLKLLNLTPAQRCLSVFVFILSYTFQNFWPWYNQTVFVLQLVGFNFLLLALFALQKKTSYLYLFISTFLIFWAFFTKQDSGGIGILFALFLLLYHCWVKKNYSFIFLYIVFLTIIGIIVIVPLLPYDFGYWFNHGQAPHSSRLRGIDFLNKIVGGSNWEKSYIAIIIFIVIKKTDRFKKFIYNEKEVLFFLLTFGTILQSLVVKVTSPLPTDHQSYFHGFAFAYVIGNTTEFFNWSKMKFFFPGVILIFFWWSALYWDYFSRIFPVSDVSTAVAYSPLPPLSPWVTSDFKAFNRIKMPESTIQGIKWIKELEVIKNNKDLKVLNMSEITPLAYELPYIPETNQPLWYHLNIGMFPKQVEEFCSKIRQKHYDLILYQDIPVLPTFYPKELQPCLDQGYKMVRKFEAPRKRTEGDSYIYVYLRK